MINETYYILHIEDEMSQVDSFRLHVIKNREFDKVKLESINARTLVEAVRYLEDPGSAPPVLIVLDPGLPELVKDSTAASLNALEAATKTLLRFIERDNIITLSGASAGREKVLDALRRKFQNAQVFSRNDIFAADGQQMMINIIQQAISKRSSGQTGQMSMMRELVTMQSTVASMSKEFDEINQMLNRHQQILISGDGVVSGLLYRMQRIESSIESLTKALETLKTKSDEGSVSIRLARMKTWERLVLLLASVLLTSSGFLGMDAIVTLIKSVVGEGK